MPTNRTPASEPIPVTVQEVNEHIRLAENPLGLTFGTDAYLLASYVRPRPSGTAVDLGGGTGIVPLLCLSRGKYRSCTAVEIQPSFCDLIARNASDNGMADRLFPLLSDVRTVTVADVGGEVDIVTANPPYMTAGSGARNRHDEKFIARHEVYGTVYDFCAAAGRLLKYGGRFFCVFRPERLTDLLDALRTSRLEPKRLTMIHATSLSKPSLVLVEAVREASPSLVVTGPFCLWQADPHHPDKPSVPPVRTEDCAYVYRHGAFPPRFTGENRPSSPSRRNPGSGPDNT